MYRYRKPTQQKANIYLYPADVRDQKAKKPSIQIMMSIHLLDLNFALY